MREPLPVVPSIVLEPGLRERLLAWYAEIADTEQELRRPVQEQHARDQIVRLQYGGVLDLNVLLEAP